MKTTITAIAISLFAMGSVAYAEGCSKNHCQAGYTYSKEAGGCVKKTVSS